MKVKPRHVEDHHCSAPRVERLRRAKWTCPECGAFWSYERLFGWSRFRSSRAWRKAVAEQINAENP